MPISNRYAVATCALTQATKSVRRQRRDGGATKAGGAESTLHAATAIPE